MLPPGRGDNLRRFQAAGRSFRIGVYAPKIDEFWAPTDAEGIFNHHGARGNEHDRFRGYMTQPGIGPLEIAKGIEWLT